VEMETRQGTAPRGAGPQAQQCRQHQPDGARDRDLRPLLRVEGPLEEERPGEVGVHPRLQVGEPLLASGQNPGDGGEDE
jgi:hypothetical protein